MYWQIWQEVQILPSCLGSLHIVVLWMDVQLQIVVWLSGEQKKEILPEDTEINSQQDDNSPRGVSGWDLLNARRGEVDELSGATISLIPSRYHKEIWAAQYPIRGDERVWNVSVCYSFQLKATILDPVLFCYISSRIIDIHTYVCVTISDRGSKSPGAKGGTERISRAEHVTESGWPPLVIHIKSERVKGTKGTKITQRVKSSN